MSLVFVLGAGLCGESLSVLLASDDLPSLIIVSQMLCRRCTTELDIRVSAQQFAELKA